LKNLRFLCITGVFAKQKRQDKIRQEAGAMEGAVSLALPAFLQRKNAKTKSGTEAGFCRDCQRLLRPKGGGLMVACYQRSG
jgi:hypothetical protein